MFADMQEALSSETAQNDERVRRVERGSRIVTVVPQDTRLILQVSTELNSKLTRTHHSYRLSAPGYWKTSFDFLNLNFSRQKIKNLHRLCLWM